MQNCPKVCWFGVFSVKLLPIFKYDFFFIFYYNKWSLSAFVNDIKITESRRILNLQELSVLINETCIKKIAAQIRNYIYIIAEC